MTGLAPPIWGLAGASPRASTLEDQRRRVRLGEFEERTNAFGHGLEALAVKPGDPTGKLLRQVLRNELREGHQSNFTAPSR